MKREYDKKIERENEINNNITIQNKLNKENLNNERKVQFLISFSNIDKFPFIIYYISYIIYSNIFIFFKSILNFKFTIQNNLTFFQIFQKIYWTM